MSAFVKTASILLGRCMETSRSMGVEVTVTIREMNEYLLMYFNERYTVYAYDPKEECKVGDILMIRKLAEPMTRKITHEVVKVIYPIGNVIDPITGKRVVVGQYKEEMLATAKMFHRYVHGLQKRRAQLQPTNSTQQ